MAKKNAGEKVGKVGKSAAGGEVAVEQSGADEGSASKTVEPAPLAPRRKRVARPKPKLPAGKASQNVPLSPAPAELAGIAGQLRELATMVRQLVTPAHATPASDIEALLEGSVDSLRRLLSELIERHVEAVVRELVDVRSTAIAALGENQNQITDRLDELLETLGAVRFEAEPMDLVDPLIHVVVEERAVARTPDGVILATVRPGYRTARGLVVERAAVAVNRRA